MSTLDMFYYSHESFSHDYAAKLQSTGHPQSLEPLESLDRNFFLNASYDGGDRQKAPAFRLAENRKIPRGISP